MDALPLLNPYFDSLFEEEAMLFSQ